MRIKRLNVYDYLVYRFPEFYLRLFNFELGWGRGGGGISYSGLHGESWPERGRVGKIRVG